MDLDVEYCKTVLNSVCKRIERVRPDLRKGRYVFLLHDNATRRLSPVFWPENWSRYLVSPDFSSLDYSLFPELRIELKENGFP